MLIYIAGQYSGDVSHNIQIAKEESLKLWKMGFTVFCPHMNTANFENDIPYNRVMDGCIEILEKCDAVVLLQNWEQSTGAKIEKEFAENHDIPVYYSPEIPYPRVHTSSTDHQTAMGILQALFKKKEGTHTFEEVEYNRHFLDTLRLLFPDIDQLWRIAKTVKANHNVLMARKKIGEIFTHIGKTLGDAEK